MRKILLFFLFIGFIYSFQSDNLFIKYNRNSLVYGIDFLNLKERGEDKEDYKFQKIETYFEKVLYKKFYPDFSVLDDDEKENIRKFLFRTPDVEKGFAIFDHPPEDLKFYYFFIPITVESDREILKKTEGNYISKNMIGILARLLTTGEIAFYSVVYTPFFSYKMIDTKLNPDINIDDLVNSRFVNYDLDPYGINFLEVLPEYSFKFKHIYGMFFRTLQGYILSSPSICDLESVGEFAEQYTALRTYCYCNNEFKGKGVFTKSKIVIPPNNNKYVFGSSHKDESGNIILDTIEVIDDHCNININGKNFTYCKENKNEEGEREFELIYDCFYKCSNLSRQVIPISSDDPNVDKLCSVDKQDILLQKFYNSIKSKIPLVASGPNNEIISGSFGDIGAGAGNSGNTNTNRPGNEGTGNNNNGGGTSNGEGNNNNEGGTGSGGGNNNNNNEGNNNQGSENGKVEGNENNNKGLESLNFGDPSNFDKDTINSLNEYSKKIEDNSINFLDSLKKVLEDIKKTYNEVSKSVKEPIKDINGGYGCTCKYTKYLKYINKNIKIEIDFCEFICKINNMTYLFFFLFFSVLFFRIILALFLRMF